MWTCDDLGWMDNLRQCTTDEEVRGPQAGPPPQRLTPAWEQRPSLLCWTFPVAARQERPPAGSAKTRRGRPPIDPPRHGSTPGCSVGMVLRYGTNPGAAQSTRGGARAADRPPAIWAWRTNWIRHGSSAPRCSADYSDYTEYATGTVGCGEVRGPQTGPPPTGLDVPTGPGMGAAPLAALPDASGRGTAGETPRRPGDDTTR